MDTSSLDRRQFLSASAVGSVVGAGERINIGLVGFGLIGKRHVLSFQSHKHARLIAIAEAHQGRLDEGAALIGGGVKTYRDFRKLLEDKAIDAVIIATPDHWHALMTMLACAAGKDVYVEKPVTLFPREGSWMLDVAHRHKRVVQVGTQQRSGSHYQRARELLRSGRLGRILSVRMNAYRNILPGFGQPTDTAPPAALDWDMFLGPAPMRKYNPNRGLYHFRWFWDTSGGQMTNLGHHSLDILDWVMGPRWPRSVVSVGGRYALKDNGETPDTQDALFDFGDYSAVWSHREACHGEPIGWSMAFFGEKGSLMLNRKGFTLLPDNDVPPESVIPTFAGAHPVGGPRAEKFIGPKRMRTSPIRDDSGEKEDQFAQHSGNFLDCVKSRKIPISDLDSGARVSTICHLANLSLRLGRQLRLDAKGELVGDAEAIRWLERPYRAPWDTVLKGVRT